MSLTSRFTMPSRSKRSRQLWVVTLGPLLLSLGVNIFTKINTVDAPCPVCGAQLQGFKNAPNQCPSCGTMLMAQKGKFEALGSGYVRDETGAQQEFTRVGDSGVIDVDAIEDSDVIDV